MLDRVRESLFATLRDWIEDAKVLDLFAGSGSLGLEALSRGAKAARLIEKHRPTLELLRQNVADLGFEERVEALAIDALAPSSWRGGKLFDGSSAWDLVFLDPPYPMIEDGLTRPKVIEAVNVLVREHLETAGRVVLHVPRGSLTDAMFARDTSPELRTWGTNDVWIVGKKKSETKA